MNPERPRNLATSALQRLLERAREGRNDFNYVAELLRERARRSPGEASFAAPPALETG